MKNAIISLKIFIIFCAILCSNKIYAQLGFCGGNSGDAIFTETFGTGTNNIPLPPGTTTYTYINGDPQDGQYIVSSSTAIFDWHNTLDHTPNDSNGRSLIVNADFTSGEFYKTTISGLCGSTTYEFSSWLINLLPPSGCGGSGIPVNVRFEIWNSSDTNLLASGNTGNIVGTSTPNWQQFALVFQTLIGQTSVILKMINNGVGGCGNDLAIDDIVFKTCGDFISTVDIFNNTNITICSAETPYSLDLSAIPDNTVFSSHFYQWQESTNGSLWTDIVGATSQNISISGITTTIYYRAKVAEFSANLSNIDCITFSNVFQVSIIQPPDFPTLECWEIATINNVTCDWDITGTQPEEPTNLECWESIAFNDSTCSWNINGAQPEEPTNIACWQMTTFNNMTCSWDISGTQPEEPTDLECWETTNFNDLICNWDITGTQPEEPTNLECWQYTSFNTTTCSWDVLGEQAQEFVEEFIDLCENDSVTLSGNEDIINAIFLWNTGETTESIEVNEPGTYSVEITDINCSTTVKTIYVSQIDAPIIESVNSNGNAIVILIANSGNFEYSIDGNSYQISNSIIASEGGLYTIYVRDRNGCGITTIEHLHFVIPKFFTPNDDGYNDTFELKGIENYSSSEVYIFNRLGKLLKSAKNHSFSWDGTFNNVKLPTSDYWYIIIIENQEFRGNLTLKR